MSPSSNTEEQFYDPCRDYSAVTRSPSHTWTTEQKIALWLLKERFVISWSDIKLIFHRLFDDELYSFLSPSKAAITSMWYQLKKQRFNPTGSWSSIERALELKAAELGMVLEKRIASTSEQRNDPLESFLRSNFTEEEDDSDQTLLGDEYLDPRTPSKRSRNRPASGALEFRSPVSMKSTVGLRRREAEITIPKIGFRTYTNDNQGINSPERFLAGSFIDKQMTTSPHPKSLYYQTEAIRHIAREHTGGTPFISVTSSIIRCLHIAFQNASASSIAILDLHHLAEIDKPQEDAVKISKLQWVPSLKLKTGDNYRGTSEYLVWGCIDKDAIIRTVSTSDLLANLLPAPNYPDPFRLKTMRTVKWTRDVHIDISRNRLIKTRETGRAVGLLASEFRIPEGILRIFVHIIVTEWQIKSALSHNNEVFSQGILEGFNSVLQQSMFEGFLESVRGHLLANAASIEQRRDTQQSEEFTTKFRTRHNNRAIIKRHSESDSIKQENRDTRRCCNGRWRAIEGHGQWSIRVFDASPGVEKI